MVFSLQRGNLLGDKLSVSIIVPALNEAGIIQNQLEYLRSLDDSAEIIVVDGGSADSTIELARKHAHSITAERGRGSQMNAGARIASGDILWFVHADCKPSKTSIHSIRKALEDKSVVGGGFYWKLDNFPRLMKYLQSTSNLKNRLKKTLYGDMGIFVREEVFKKIGGFKNIPLMEDMDFCKRLKRQGKVVILKDPMETSSRRWRKEGIIKVYVRNNLLKLAYRLGVSPAYLAKFYKFG
ncbi:MAG: glycosyltransferase [candidate division Zixibacteria bacterium]|nr:glycosyltransferase [candidate division Zixibacteria bacterium]